MPDLPPALDLTFNPFEPAASGPPIGIPFSPSATLESRLRDLVQALARARGSKVIVILGDYGAGKTCLLQWLHDELLPEHRIRSYYFDNPGVHFYALANTLLRTIGRKDFAKFIWELAGPHVQTPYQQSFFRTSFEEYLSAESRPARRPRQEIAAPLRAAIMAAGVTSDEQIAHCLARIVTDAVRKPYFEYRDFLPREKQSLVAEAEEAPYFGAILKTLSRGFGAAATAFLIDEFEEIGLQKRLNQAGGARLPVDAEAPDQPHAEGRQPVLVVPVHDPRCVQHDVRLTRSRAPDRGVAEIRPCRQDRTVAARRHDGLESVAPRRRQAADTGESVPNASVPVPRRSPLQPCDPGESAPSGQGLLLRDRGRQREPRPVPFTTAYLRDVEARLFSTGSYGTQDAPSS